MLYLIQGYLFVAVYNFMRFKHNELNNVFFKSIISSYILKLLFDGLFVTTITTDNATIKCTRLLHFPYESVVYVITLLVFAVLLAYILARITQSSRFNCILSKIGVARTTNPNIWADVIKPDCWLMVYLRSS